MLVLCHRRYRREKGQDLCLLLNLPLHKLSFQSKKEEREGGEGKGKGEIGLFNVHFKPRVHLLSRLRLALRSHRLQ
ncbi:uncharacterized protein [Misgurnus anguillicaudatus]|uniref:uncharacterized protein n=1 Tax=Misgurnus anguillicaudatus TaxID=75329 RepID=UPI003CCF7364